MFSRFPFAQRWQINRENIQPIVQVFPEFTILSHLFQVLVGRSDDTNVDSRCARAADCLKLTFLQDAEHLRLNLQWHVSNFIEEQSAAIGQREAADMRVDGTRKGSAFVPEQLAFKKAGGGCRANYLHQGSVPAKAAIVKCANHY